MHVKARVKIRALTGFARLTFRGLAFHLQCTVLCYSCANESRTERTCTKVLDLLLRLVLTLLLDNCFVFSCDTTTVNKSVPASLVQILSERQTCNYYPLSILNETYIHVR